MSTGREKVESSFVNMKRGTSATFSRHLIDRNRSLEEENVSINIHADTHKLCQRGLEYLIHILHYISVFAYVT